jgi:hypothetical protein
MQEQVHRLCRKQLPIHGRRNWVELANIIGPGEFNLKAVASPIVANAPNLSFTGWRFDVHCRGAVHIFILILRCSFN